MKIIARGTCRRINTPIIIPRFEEVLLVYQRMLSLLVFALDALNPTVGITQLALKRLKTHVTELDLVAESAHRDLGFCDAS
jgi:hypothetical protein